MTILTEQDILNEIGHGRLITNGSANSVSTCSYDMAVGTIFHNGHVIDSTHPSAHGQVIVEPGEVVTMLTSEHLQLPDDIAATAYAMNSQSSEGFLVLNPGHVDPGYVGPLEIKAINLRKVPRALSLGDPIFTVVFQRLDKPAPGYASHNISLGDKVRNVRKKDVELSVRSISDLVALSGRFPTEEKITQMINANWIGRVSLILSLVAAVGALIAAVFAVIPVVMGDSNKPDKTVYVTQNPSTSTEVLKQDDKSKKNIDHESNHQNNKENPSK